MIKSASPGRIISRLLIARGHGVADPAGVWGVTFNGLPAETGNDAIGVYSSTNLTHGKDGRTGRHSRHYGVQVMIRSALPEAGLVKAQVIAEDVAKIKATDAVTVTIDDVVYKVKAVHDTSGAIPLGVIEQHRRAMTSLNLLCDLEEVEP